MLSLRLMICPPWPPGLRRGLQKKEAIGLPYGLGVPVLWFCLLLRRGGLCRGQRLLGRLDQLVEGLGLRERQLRQGLPVQLDLGHAETVDKSVIRNPSKVAGGVDADDPHPAVVPLLVLAAEVRVLAGAHDGFAARAVELAPAGAKSLRALQDLLDALLAVRAALL